MSEVVLQRLRDKDVGVEHPQSHDEATWINLVSLYHKLSGPLRGKGYHTNIGVGIMIDEYPIDVDRVSFLPTDTSPTDSSPACRSATEGTGGLI